MEERVVWARRVFFRVFSKTRTSFTGANILLDRNLEKSNTVYSICILVYSRKDKRIYIYFLRIVEIHIEKLFTICNHACPVSEIGIFCIVLLFFYS